MYNLNRDGKKFYIVDCLEFLYRFILSTVCIEENKGITLQRIFNKNFGLWGFGVLHTLLKRRSEPFDNFWRKLLKEISSYLPFEELKICLWKGLIEAFLSLMKDLWNDVQKMLSMAILHEEKFLRFWKSMTSESFFWKKLWDFAFWAKTFWLELWLRTVLNFFQ